MNKPFVIKGDAFDAEFGGVKWLKRQRLGKELHEHGFVLCPPDKAEMFVKDKKRFVALYRRDLPMRHRNNHILIIPL